MRQRSGLAGRAATQAPWRWCWLVLLTLSAGTAAQPSRDGAASRPVRSDTQWLQAIQAAAQRVNFTGTVVYQQGGSMRSSRIVHLWDGRSSHERLQMLDGKAREFIRKDVEVQCLFPEARRVLVERGLPGESFPSIGGGAPREILENYSLKLGSIERVAGVDCQVLLLEPRDALRYGHRLCVEPASSLLLRAETLDLRQEPIDQMAFTDVRPADLARLGWNISPPAGFRVLRQVERRGAEAARAVYQSVLSDGLATLSVFIDFNDSAQTGGADLAHQHGALSGYSRRVGSALVTVVGEVPPATAKAVAHGVTVTSSPAALPDRRRSRGAGAIGAARPAGACRAGGAHRHAAGLCRSGRTSQPCGGQHSYHRARRWCQCDSRRPARTGRERSVLRVLPALLSPARAPAAARPAQPAAAA